jgi:RNA polymerase sigma-70 factor, ECF subfamily
VSEPVAAAARALGVTLDAAAFEAWCGARPRTHAKDLVLVWACLAGQASAIAHLEAAYLSRVSRALGTLRASESFVDELVGWLRVELFAREGGPLLATWSGRGDLATWLKAIAVHEALKRLKRGRREVPHAALERIPVPAVELIALKGAYRAEFSRALREAFAALEVAERNLLRQYFLDGLSIDQLGALLGIHRSTAARRVAAAREALSDGVRRRLMSELSLGESGVDELITLSNLDESLNGLLRASRQK